MSHEEIQAAYDRISGRFPAEWDVEINVAMRIGRATKNRLDSALKFRPIQRPVDETNFSLHVTAGGVDYVEIDVDLDEIERAAEAIIEQIAAAEGEPIKARQMVGREHLALSPASDGSGRAA